jgi:putative restriction endonuclease
MTESQTILASTIELLYDLNVGIIGTGSERHERPHKPVLLLATLDLMDQGQATPAKIPWNQPLRARFSEIFNLVKGCNDQNTPENPFLRLSTDAFWNPTILNGSSHSPLQHNPLVSEMGRVFASIAPAFAAAFASAAGRKALREALIARYFPHAREELLIPAKCYPVAIESHLAEEPIEFGRNPAFRRKILEVYDHQCSACGLRIKLPVSDTSFVDAAHLIPFASSYNDHPSNGLALCKNHHWAMDRFLIAPGPDRIWHVSPTLDPRRSSGEAELLHLNTKPLLLPHDDAFLPALDSLQWRVSRLVAS